MTIDIDQLRVLAAKAGGAVIGLIVLYWTRKIIRGIK